jgi:hypothetical protein
MSEAISSLAWDRISFYDDRYAAMFAQISLVKGC